MKFYLVLLLIIEFKFVKLKDYYGNVVCKFICESTLAE